MTSTVVVGKNSYGLLTDATAYLMDSIRATAWADTDEEVQRRALISAWRLLEKQRWAGTKAGLQVATVAAVQAGGTGYMVGDILTAVGGTTNSAALIEVLTAPGGVVATVQMIDEGAYSAVPSNPVATTGGAGTGCALNLTFGVQTAAFPMTGLVDQYGTAVSGTTIPLQVKQAEYELAYELSRDSDLETATGTGSNISEVHAGPVGVSYFRPTDGPGRDQRFPTVVMELIAPFLGGPMSATATITGTDLTSSFDSDDEFTFSAGLP